MASTPIAEQSPTSRAPSVARWLLLIGAALLLVAVAGCMVGPDYQPPAMKLPAHWNAIEEQTADPQTGKSDLSSWWRSFDDPLLDEIVAQALSSNLDEKIARARIREARAYLTISRAGLFPSIGTFGSYTRQRYSANTPFGYFPQLLPRDQNIYEAGFDASWELDVFGGIRRGVEASKAELAASIENARDVRVSLLAEVAREYVAVRVLERRLQIARANLRDQNDSLKLAQARFEQGFAPELDVFQARSLLETTQAQVPELESELEQTVHRIGVLLGSEPDALQAELSDMAPIPGIADPDAIAVQIPAGLPSDLLRRRPDIRAAEREIAAATARVGVATADLFPKFNIIGTVGLESISTSDFFFGTSRMWQVGPSMRWPSSKATGFGPISRWERAGTTGPFPIANRANASPKSRCSCRLCQGAPGIMRHASAEDFRRSRTCARRYEEGYASF